MKRVTQAAIALAVVTAGITATATGAQADPIPTAPSTSAPTGHSASVNGRTLQGIQTTAAATITRRLSALGTAIPAVTANAQLSPADKSTLLATLNHDKSGLTALGQQIASDTTVKQAASDYQTIFTTYRVYALALPQVYLSAATDDITVTVLPAVQAAQTTLSALLAGPDAAKNTTATFTKAGS